MGEYVRLLELFEVALRQTSDVLLIPSHLPASTPVMDVPQTRELLDANTDSVVRAIFVHIWGYHSHVWGLKVLFRVLLRV